MNQVANLALTLIAVVLMGGLIFSGYWIVAAIAVPVWASVEFWLTERRRDRA